MKREDITKVFEGATEEQISAILDINSKDIGKAKGDVGKLQADLDTANATLTTARNTIKALEDSKGDTEKLQKQIDEFKAAEETRKAEEAAVQLHAAIEARFNTTVGELKFLHEFVRTGVLGEFEKALADTANRGKSDKDIFEALTKDKGYFSSQNPPANMGGIHNTDPTTDKDKFLKMTVYEQMMFANAHPEQAAEYLK